MNHHTLAGTELIVGMSHTDFVNIIQRGDWFDYTIAQLLGAWLTSDVISDDGLYLRWFVSIGTWAACATQSTWRWLSILSITPPLSRRQKRPTEARLRTETAPLLPVGWSGLVSRETTMKQFSEKKKRGCPTCSGVDARSCMRCQGKTRMCDWYNTETGWAHYTQLNHDERAKANDAHASG